MTNHQFMTKPVTISATASDTEVQAYKRALAKAKTPVESKDTEIMVVFAEPTQINGEIITAVKVKANDIRLISQVKTNKSTTVFAKIESLGATVEITNDLTKLVKETGHKVILIPSLDRRTGLSHTLVVYPERICSMIMNLSVTGHSTLVISQVGMLESGLHSNVMTLGFKQDYNHEEVQSLYENIAAMCNEKTPGLTVEDVGLGPKPFKSYMLANIKTVDLVGFVGVGKDCCGREFLLKNDTAGCKFVELRPYVQINGRKYTVNHSMEDLLKMVSN